VQLTGTYALTTNSILKLNKRKNVKEKEYKRNMSVSPGAAESREKSWVAAEFYSLRDKIPLLCSKRIHTPMCQKSCTVLLSNK